MPTVERDRWNQIFRVAQESAIRPATNAQPSTTGSAKAERKKTISPTG